MPSPYEQVADLPLLYLFNFFEFAFKFIAQIAEFSPTRAEFLHYLDFFQVW